MYKSIYQSIKNTIQKKHTLFDNKKNEYTGAECCLDMDVMLENKDGIYNLIYQGAFREYCLRDLNSSDKITFIYCPWCAYELPKSLRDQLVDVLEKECGLSPFISEDIKQIPAEFFTDEWWKKRGL